MYVRQGTTQSLSWGSFAKETCVLREPTNRSHLIAIHSALESVRYPSHRLKSTMYCYEVATISRLPLNTQVSFAKEPYKRDYILRKRPIFLRSLLIIVTSYMGLSKRNTYQGTYLRDPCHYVCTPGHTHRYHQQYVCTYTDIQENYVCKHTDINSTVYCCMGLFLRDPYSI